MRRGWKHTVTPALLRLDPMFIRSERSALPKTRGLAHAEKNRKAQPGCSTKRSHARHKMKYWEMIADISAKPVEFLGCISAIDSNRRTMWTADAHRGDGKSVRVRADKC